MDPDLNWEIPQRRLKVLVVYVSTEDVSLLLVVGFSFKGVKVTFNFLSSFAAERGAAEGGREKRDSILPSNSD